MSPSKESQTFRIELNGQVQGVGFRPFVYSLAKSKRIKGKVYNNKNGVSIEINCSEEKAHQFLKEIIHQKPEMAHIDQFQLNAVNPLHFDDFKINDSTSEGNLNLPLTPDFAICESCKKEILDPNNRRYKYAFTTCVSCGPRYAITHTFPFERKNTTLANFEMCQKCQEEYSQASERRFHSQTNSCKTCGIRLSLKDGDNQIVSEDQNEIIAVVAQLILKGNIIAIKNTSGYLLCCDATNPQVLKKLRKRKNRARKPFAVMYPDIKKIQKEFYLSKEEEKILCSSIAPILIVNPTEKCSVAKEEIAPKLSQIGIMLPNSGLFTLLMNELKNPIVSTSGNKNGDPILATEKKVTEQLKNTADYFLHHNMKILFPQDDSIFKYTDNHTIIQRHARGLAPTYLQMKNPKNTTTLSMGASLKSTFTYFPNEYIYFSQYFGDSENIETLNRFKKTVAQFHSLFNCTPCTVLIDQHPLYSSHQLGKEWAKKWNADLISIQHHKAHFCSVLGEHNLFETKEQILGVIWDGMGLGEDQQIWGGEFFIYENQKIIRADHLEYFDWLAHEKMAREPRISLLSLTKDIQQVQSRFSKTELQLFTQLKKKNRLKTSSMGRLFDAVASALDLIDQNSYEAEAAILLENCAKKYDQSKPIDLLEKHQRLSPYLIIQEILKFHKKGVKKNRLAFSFIYTLSKQIFRIAKENKIKTVALSGGVFQNTLLISTISKIAAKEKINLKINCKLPSNDENISFGQFIYLNQIKN